VMGPAGSALGLKAAAKARPVLVDRARGKGRPPAACIARAQGGLDVPGEDEGRSPF